MAVTLASISCRTCGHTGSVQAGCGSQIRRSGDDSENYHDDCPAARQDCKPTSAHAREPPAWLAVLRRSAPEGVLDLRPGLLKVALDLVTAASGPQATATGDTASGLPGTAFDRFGLVRNLPGGAPGMSFAVAWALPKPGGPDVGDARPDSRVRVRPPGRWLRCPRRLRSRPRSASGAG